MTAPRLAAAMRTALTVPSAIITSDRVGLTRERVVEFLRQLGTRRGAIGEGGVRIEQLPAQWPWPDPTPRQVTELRILVEQLEATEDRIGDLRGEVRQRNADRHDAVRASQLRAAAHTEILFADIELLREHETDLRAELTAAHRRAVESAYRRRANQGHPPPGDPEVEARAEHRRATLHEQETWVALERAVAEPGHIDHLRRLALLHVGLAAAGVVGIATVIGLALAGMFTTNGLALMWLGLVLMLGLLVAEVYSVVQRGRTATAVRRLVGPARRHYEQACDRLLVAEAGMLAAGLAVVRMVAESESPQLSES